MPDFYANISLKGVEVKDAIAFLKSSGYVAYVAANSKGDLVVFHEDFASQEQLAISLSAHFSRPVLLVMVFGGSVLLYHLYQDGNQVDAYVSSPHGELELDGPAPPGDAGILCAAFEAERFERRVGAILAKEAKPDQPYAYAVNRHGELARALGLPAFAAGTGFANIELGELPVGAGFDPQHLVRTQ